MNSMKLKKYKPMSTVRICRGTLHKNKKAVVLKDYNEYLVLLIDNKEKVLTKRAVRFYQEPQDKYVQYRENINRLYGD